MAIKSIITIGRSAKSDYHIDRESVSNEQALLIGSYENNYLLIDCNSLNGTRGPGQLGSNRIAHLTISGNEAVVFGDYECLVNDIITSSSGDGFVDNNNDFTQFRDPLDGSIKRKPRT